MNHRKTMVGFLMLLVAHLLLAASTREVMIPCSGGTPSTKATIVYPDHYAKDPGAGFALVLLSDVTQPTQQILDFADAYKNAIFVCAGTADRKRILAEVLKDKRIFAFARGRIEIPSSDLGATDAANKLRTYFAWGRYQAGVPKLTRYGARIYRQERKDTPPPQLMVPTSWRIVDGDDGETGCDRRLAYFTIEADGENLPAPEVTVSWPGVAISSVDSAANVRMTDGGVVLTPTGRSGGANYITMVKDGAIEIALYHHVEGAQHGPYAGMPLPWIKLRASDNWRAACHAMFKAAGVDTREATDGASIKLYGFDSNFPRRHVDYPEHFHVMLEWGGWTKNNVGHYTLDEKGFIRGNNFLVCGDIAGGLSAGYHRQKPCETTDYVGPKGVLAFSLEMLPEGKGLLLRKPRSKASWRIFSECPAEEIAFSERQNDASDWTERGVYSVTDDTERGRYVILCKDRNGERRETLFYVRDTGAIKH